MKSLILVSLLNAGLVIGAINTVDQARQELMVNSHINNIQTVYGSPTFNREFYQNQLDSIALLGRAGNSDDVKLLIPYLDYPGSGAYSISSFGPVMPDFQTIRKSWPAFDAIAAIPHADQTLLAYGTNKHNLLDYRLTAFLVLRYIAPDSLEKGMVYIKEREPDNVKLIAYVGLIQKGTFAFTGIVNHKNLDFALAEK